MAAGKDELAAELEPGLLDRLRLSGVTGVVPSIWLMSLMTA